MDDNALLELFVLFAIFGPLPVAYMTWPDHKEYLVFGFIGAFAAGFASLSIIGLWVLVLYIPAAWYFAFKPIISPGH